MVVRSKEDIALELNQVVVESLNRFQIEVVGRCVENQTVGILQLHTSNHTTHLLTTREHVDMLQHIFFLEKHTTEERLHGDLVAGSPLAEPVYKVHLALEEISIVEGQVGGGDSDTPLISTSLCLAVAIDNLEESGHSLGVMREEHGLLPLLDGEVHIVEEYGAIGIHGLQSFYLKNLCTRFALHLEDDTRILTCRGRNLLNIKFFEHLLSRSGLL